MDVVAFLQQRVGRRELPIDPHSTKQGPDKHKGAGPQAEWDHAVSLDKQQLDGSVKRCTTVPAFERRDETKKLWPHVDEGRKVVQRSFLQGWIQILEAGREERLTCNSYSILMARTNMWV
ncbi:hypothetical protein PABG_11468 [Paracoccidioides brasiliensis Pb03]|nr:hypothetical protein PABG_11468 [Paracoccidioides brasiliensis Pb03]